MGHNRTSDLFRAPKNLKYESIYFYEAKSSSELLTMSKLIEHLHNDYAFNFIISNYSYLNLHIIAS
jgi:hypothetical protein